MVETSIRKIGVEIDEELLEAVQSVLETKTVESTIEAAFLHVLRRAEVEALSAMQGMDLGDDELMERAWRTQET